MKRPLRGDYAPYYETYVGKVDGQDIIAALKRQHQGTQKLFENVPESRGEYRYAEGKWSLKEVIGHMIDTERVMAYRAYCFSRNESQALPGFEQDDYIAAGNSQDRALKDLLHEFRVLREANIAMAEGFAEEMLDRKGTASGCGVTVNALLYIIAGHELHHLKIIKERYL